MGAMDVEIDKDIQRRVLEVLTAACSDIRHSDGESPLLDNLLDQLGGNLGLFAYKTSREVTMPASEWELAALIQEVVEDAAEQIQMKALSAIGYLMLLFCSVALEVERKGAAVSIDEFLSNAGLELAMDDGTGADAEE
jgi:hypothetical protein